MTPQLWLLVLCIILSAIAFVGGLIGALVCWWMARGGGR
jgi:hypothetical protein